MTEKQIEKLIVIYSVLAIEDLMNDNLTKPQEKAIIDLGNFIQDEIDKLEKSKK